MNFDRNCDCCNNIYSYTPFARELWSLKFCSIPCRDEYAEVTGSGFVNNLTHQEVLRKCTKYKTPSNTLMYEHRKKLGLPCKLPVKIQLSYLRNFWED